MFFQYHLKGQYFCNAWGFLSEQKGTKAVHFAPAQLGIYNVLTFLYNEMA